MFDLHIVPDVFQFLGQQDGRFIVQLAEIAPQVKGEVMYQIGRHLRLLLAQLLHGAEGIVNKVGLDLAEHGGDPAVLQLLLQLFGTDGRLMVDHDMLGRACRVEHEQQGKHGLCTGAVGVDAPAHAGNVQQNGGQQEHMGEQDHAAFLLPVMPFHSGAGDQQRAEYHLRGHPVDARVIDDCNAGKRQHDQNAVQQGGEEHGRLRGFPRLSCKGAAHTETHTVDGQHHTQLSGVGVEHHQFTDKGDPHGVQYHKAAHEQRQQAVFPQAAAHRDTQNPGSQRRAQQHQRHDDEHDTRHLKGGAVWLQVGFQYVGCIRRVIERIQKIPVCAAVAMAVGVMQAELHHVLCGNAGRHDIVPPSAAHRWLQGKPFLFIL